RLLRTRLAAKQSEDCLYLNVRTVSSLPVLVYIHGGDYHDGAGASRPFYLSNALPIKGDVVLVTFNYRLGLLGHFCHPDLSEEAEAAGRPAVSGNYSILDQ
ncbi:unnamed protein product, partial [Ectocarpus sp. 8 AP-2014]